MKHSYNSTTETLTICSENLTRLKCPHCKRRAAIYTTQKNSWGKTILYCTSCSFLYSFTPIGDIDKVDYKDFMKRI